MYSVQVSALFDTSPTQTPISFEELTKCFIVTEDRMDVMLSWQLPWQHRLGQNLGKKKCLLYRGPVDLMKIHDIL